MTRAQLQALIRRDPNESHADYRLVVKQGETSAEYLVTTPELIMLIQQLQQVVPDHYLDD